MDIYTIQSGDVLFLYDQEIGYTHRKYVYSYEGKHIFTPEDDTRDPIRRNELVDVLKYNNPMDANGGLLANYINVSDLSCYQFNNIQYPTAVIIALAYIIPPSYMVGQSEAERNQSLREAVMLPPITVKLVGDKYVILNGNHRYHFSAEMGFHNIPAIIQ
jgi:hypothetical protein